jgi:hypothetical protein
VSVLQLVFGWRGQRHFQADIPRRCAQVRGGAIRLQLKESNFALALHPITLCFSWSYGLASVTRGPRLTALGCFAADAMFVCLSRLEKKAKTKVPSLLSLPRYAFRDTTQSRHATMASKRAAKKAQCSATLPLGGDETQERLRIAAKAWSADGAQELLSPPDVEGLPSVVVSQLCSDCSRTDAYGHADGTMYIRVTSSGIAWGQAPQWFQSRWTPSARTSSKRAQSSTAALSDVQERLLRAAKAWKGTGEELASPPDVMGLPSVRASEFAPDRGHTDAYGCEDGTMYLELTPSGMVCGMHGQCAPRWVKSRWTPPAAAGRTSSKKKKKQKNASAVDDLLILADVDLNAGVQTRQRRKSLTPAPDRPAAAAAATTMTIRRARARARAVVEEGTAPAYTGTTIEDLIGYCFNLKRVRALMDPQVWPRVEEQFMPHVAQAKRDAQLFRANLATRLIDPELQWSDLGMRAVFARSTELRVVFRAVLYPSGDEAEQRCFEAVFATEPQRVLARFKSHAALLDALMPLTDYAYWLPYADSYEANPSTVKLPSYVNMEASLTKALIEKDAENSRLDDPQAIAQRDAPKPNPFYVEHGNRRGNVFDRLLHNKA